jgi:hypothetical protein
MKWMVHTEIITENLRLRDHFQHIYLDSAKGKGEVVPVIWYSGGKSPYIQNLGTVRDSALRLHEECEPGAVP